ncbi:MAG: insulinase family protein [Muribaculaceae bacterium]|nr:insulinase family protein [Muribaculaceae bacterium]
MARSGVEHIDTIILSNGLRVAARQVRSVAECCGVAILAGSRNETPDEHGLAHFVEHTIFKGTRRRRSHHVINRMETVGGELNAYTTKEETFVYTIAPAGNLLRSVELLADLVTDCTFPDAELDKEREVVAEEIDSYLDSPVDAVYDDFEDIIFKGNPLGHNILGTKESIARFDSRACRAWIDRYYRAPNMVFFYTGPASTVRVFAAAERYFSRLKANYFRENVVQPEVIPLFRDNRPMDFHQAHTLMGARVGGLYDADRHALALFNNILGGPGMNSRLNVALRERRGLVYSVDSSLTLYGDCGLLSIYFGCDDSDVEKCRRLVEAEIEILATRPLSQRALMAARRQYVGQVTVAGGSIEQSALSLGRSALRSLGYPSPAVLTGILDSISSDDIARIAASLPQLSSLTFS